MNYTYHPETSTGLGVLVDGVSLLSHFLMPILLVCDLKSNGGDPRTRLRRSRLRDSGTAGTYPAQQVRAVPTNTQYKGVGHHAAGRAAGGWVPRRGRAERPSRAGLLLDISKGDLWDAD